MQRLLAAIVLIAGIGVAAPVWAQVGGGGGPTPTPPAGELGRGTVLTPLGAYVVATGFCAGAAPIVATAILQRPLTYNEAYRSTFGCFLGPLGWVLADALVPPGFTGLPPASPNPPPTRTTGRRNVNIPPPSETRFVPDEILVEDSGRSLDALARRLQLTQLETQTFALTGRSIQRWRIGGGRTVPATLRALNRSNAIAFAQPNWTYMLPQAAAQAAPGDNGQWSVSKLRLREVHRITDGNNVPVAVIDSRIDTTHPDFAGMSVEEFDALGGGGKAHDHGTGMASAIAAHSKLLGVAPKVRLLAVRAFAGEGESAQGTTFNILKGVDWAAGQGARVMNMSFAGPSDTLLRDMLGKAHARGIVLIAAVGNAGPKSPPLYPAADANVIGVTATDSNDKLLPQANRGAQVAIAAPGVDILAAAPDGQYQVTTGTSIAAAHVSGVAALLLARNKDLKPDALRKLLAQTAQPASGKRNETGAGVIDAYGALGAVAR